MMQIANQVENVVRHWKDHLSCTDPECRGSRRVWRRISDGAGSIHLHGMRFCFPDCFERELTRRLGEMRSSLAGKARAPHRVPLGLLMLSRGDIDNRQLQKALAAQRESGTGRIGEWIEKLGFARQEQITAALAWQWCCPVLRTLPTRPADCEVPFPLLRRFGMAPVHYVKATRILHIAFAASVEYRALLAIEQMLQCKAEPCITSSRNLANMLARLEEERSRNDHAFENIRRKDEIVRVASSYAGRLGAEEVRLALCSEHVWIRLEAADTANLLFWRPAEIPPLALDTQHLATERAW